MMNKNTSMSSIYNFFQDLLTNKIPVEKGPLEQINNSNKDSNLHDKIYQNENEGCPEDQQILNKGNNFLL